MRCKSYYYGSGIMRLSHGRRCELAAGHAERHSCYRAGIGAPFTFRWGRKAAAA